MIETIAYFVGIAIIFVIAIALLGNGSGCGGNCKQGRTKCDCKNIF